MPDPKRSCQNTTYPAVPKTQLEMTIRIIDDQPWRRVYVVLAPDASVPFKPLH